MNPFPVALADMRQDRLSTILTVLLIGLAVGLGIAVSAQERGLHLASNRAADPFDLLIGAPGSKTQLLMSSVYLQAAAIPLIDGHILSELQEQEHIRYAAPIGFGDSFKGYPVIGTIARMADLAGERPLEGGHLFTHIDEAVVGIDVHLKIGETFFSVHGHGNEEENNGEEHHQHTAFHYRVVGKMHRWGSPWDKAILVPIEAVWFIHGLGTGHGDGELEHSQDYHDVQKHASGHHENERHGTDESHQRHAHYSHNQLEKIPVGQPWDPDEIPGVPVIALAVDKAADAYRLRSRYNHQGVTMAFFPAEILLQMYALLGDAGAILSVLAVATQVLVVAAVLLAVLASLSLKKKQFGVLRALGAGRLYVCTVIWTNVVIMVSSGALLGIGVGWFTAEALSYYIGRESGLVLPVTITQKELLMALVLVGFSLVLAMVPALIMYRQRVSSLLRE